MPHNPLVSAEAIMTVNSRLSITQEAIELSEKANVVMMGLWTPHTNDEVVIRGILSKEQIDAIEAFHPVVDINHWVFDAQGRCINELMDPPPYHLTGFPIPRLKEKIRKEGAKVILVAGGGPSYVPAIRAALNAGHQGQLYTRVTEPVLRWCLHPPHTAFQLLKNPQALLHDRHSGVPPHLHRLLLYC